MRENEQRLSKVLVDRIFLTAGTIRRAAPLVRMAQATLYRKIAEPERLTVRDLRTLVEELNVSEEKLLPALREAIYGSESPTPRSE